MRNEKQYQRWQKWHKKGFSSYMVFFNIFGLLMGIVIGILFSVTESPSWFLPMFCTGIVTGNTCGIMSWLMCSMEGKKYEAKFVINHSDSMLKKQKGQIDGDKAFEAPKLPKKDESLIRWVDENIRQGKTSIDIPADLFEEAGDEALNETRRLCKLNNVKINSAYIMDRCGKNYKDAELVCWIDEKTDQGLRSIDIPSQLLIGSSDRALEEVGRLLKLRDMAVSGIYYEGDEAFSKKDESLIRWVNEKINQGDRNI
jgi:hypothetical protein